MFCPELTSITNQLSAQAKEFYHLQLVKSTPSTNLLIKEAIAAKKPEGTAVMALQQTAGYGRQRRQWASPVGGLYLSLLLRPSEVEKTRNDTATLSLVLSLVVKETLEKLGAKIPLSVKWPNDVLCDQGKLSGIYLEAIDGALCVGLGINLFVSNKKMPLEGKYAQAYASVITNEDDVCHEVPSEGMNEEQLAFFETVAANLLSEVVFAYSQWLVLGFEPFQENYRAANSLQGKTIQLVSQANGILYEGTVQDVDAQGCLCLRTEDGKVVHAHSGEVHLL